jgi:hypothetical protein
LAARYPGWPWLCCRFRAHTQRRVEAAGPRWFSSALLEVVVQVKSWVRRSSETAIGRSCSVETSTTPWSASVSTCWLSAVLREDGHPCRVEDSRCDAMNRPALGNTSNCQMSFRDSVRTRASCRKMQTLHAWKRCALPPTSGCIRGNVDSSMGDVVVDREQQTRSQRIRSAPTSGLADVHAAKRAGGKIHKMRTRRRDEMPHGFNMQIPTRVCFPFTMCSLQRSQN